MMLFYRFNILNNIHKLRMVDVLVLCNWWIIDRLSWTIGTKFSFIHTSNITRIANITHAPHIAHITHVIVVVSVHSNYPLPVLEYTILYSRKGDVTCTFNTEGYGP